MPFSKSMTLENFEVFPLVVSTEKEAEITIRPLGGKIIFEKEKDYLLKICAMDGGKLSDFPLTSYEISVKVSCDENGGFSIKHLFPSEQEYALVFYDENVKKLATFYIYAVSGELVGLYPYIGDLHLHTTRSDGSEIPTVVCANYRRHGYDFLAITDHERYYPSLEAIEEYREVPHDLCIVPGEEVQLPSVNGKTNDVHIVNFGGEYSINAIVEGTATNEKGKSLEVRAIRSENVPDVMTRREYEDKIQSIADELDIPNNVERIPYAGCCWIFNEIRKANGLGIFAHPNWKRETAFHIPEVFTDYMMKTKPFDAFEVLGGENYFEQNGFQTVRYYEEKAKGNVFPIVGSTDSHCSYASLRNSLICSTIVFSKANERSALIDSIKNFHSVAVDTINEDFRLVGDSRLVRYACFLLKNYFPLHDELCFEEGRLMKQYVTGSEDEKKEAFLILCSMKSRTDRLLKKCFDF